MRTLAERIRAGLAHLASEQAPNGGFRVVVMVGGPGFPSGALTSPFVTGLVLDALHGLDEHFNTRSLIERSLAYLLDEMEVGGLWRFYRSDPPLPHDLDSTTVTLRALQRQGVSFDYPAAARRVGSHRDDAGRFYTWVVDSPSLLRRALADPPGFSRRPSNVVDPVVNANVLAFLRAVGLEAPEAERFLVARAREIGALEGSPYYLHPECLAYALSKLAETSPTGDPITAAACMLVERLTDGRAVGQQTRPFLLTRLVAASLRLRLATIDVDRAVQGVVTSQRADGSWPWGEVWTAARWAAGAPRPLLGSPALETATALEALGRCLSR